MTAFLAGIGLATPEHAISQDDAARRSLGLCVASERDRRLAANLYTHAGVRKRYSVLLEPASPGEPAPQSFYQPPAPDAPLGPTTGRRMEAYRSFASDLAVLAARRGLESSGIAPGSITHLVTVTCSGFDAPGIDVALIDRLALPTTTARTSVGFMGCHGAINGLRVAKAYCEADPAAAVLVVAVELCSLHYQYDWTPERIIANTLFSDGAAAAVVTPQREGSRAITSTFSQLIPDTLDAMSWRIGDHGFQMTLSRTLPELVEKHTGAAIRAWLGRPGLHLADVDSWAIHPGGPRVLEAAAASLGLRRETLDASWRVLAECGNMSSPTVLFVLDEIQRSGPRGPCVLLGFGPGLTIEAALIE